MTNIVWQLLEKNYKEFPQSKCCNAHDKYIKHAEQELQVKFSDSYKYFLKNHEINEYSSLIFIH